jgi:glycosyltransferase involved in cell wall biosynthesis
MKIGFDARGAFYNQSGLGTYSRTTIQLLQKHYPENEYYLYAPDSDDAIDFVDGDNIHFQEPQGLASKIFPFYWSTLGIKKELKHDKLDIYHGLINKVPYKIQQTGVHSVVTIHDIIMAKVPQLSNALKRKILTKRVKLSCEQSDRIIAVSRQTKADLINIFKIEPRKIQVVYQGCNPIFYNQVSDEVKSVIRNKHNLPQHYILSVGTIEARKNLLMVLKAMKQNKIDIPLVVVGKPTHYLREVQDYIADNHMHYIYFLQDVARKDMPVIYQMAELFVFPSMYEGFGIPILEALNSKVPVITSKGGCFEEAGGGACLYVNPRKPDELGAAMKKLLCDQELAAHLVEEGHQYVQRFREEKIIENLMSVYIDLAQNR